MPTFFHIEVLEQLQASGLRSAKDEVMAATKVGQQNVIGHLNIEQAIRSERLMAQAAPARSGGT